MDPDEALHVLLQAAERIQAAVDDGVPVDDQDTIAIADAAQALDGWLRKGGFLPDAWRR